MPIQLATIVCFVYFNTFIFLFLEYSPELVLGFERVNYVGTIENNIATLESITLSEGYSQQVLFTLHGGEKRIFSVNLEFHTLRH